MIRPALLALLLVGCVPSEIEERDFPKYGAQAMCAQERDCDRGNWLNRYSGQRDCQATWEETLKQLVELYDDLDCDCNKKEAGRAYEDVVGTSCEDWYEDVASDPFQVLDEVWDDCLGFNTFPTTYYGASR